MKPDPDPPVGSSRLPAVVLGQMANAFACRSTVRWPGSLGWRTNKLLLAAVAAELLAIAGFLFVPPLARLLGHAPPPLEGWAVAALAIPAVLAVDAVHKRLRKQKG